MPAICIEMQVVAVCFPLCIQGCVSAWHAAGCKIPAVAASVSGSIPANKGVACSARIRYRYSKVFKFHLLAVWRGTFASLYIKRKGVGVDLPLGI